MKVYSFLKKSAPFFGIKLFLFGILAGIISTLLIVIINNVIDKDPTNKIFYKEIAIAYAVAMALFFIIQYIYQTMLIKMSQKLIWSLRVKVLDNIRNCDFGKFQRIGYEHVYTVLTTDVENISFLSNVLASIVTSAVTILFCLVYMAWLTPSGFWITIVMIIIVMAVYLLRQKKIMQQLNDSRDKENEFFKYIHHLVYGIKEVKMSRPASDDLFLNYLSHTAKDAESLKTNSNIAFMNNSLLGQLYFFVILGVFLFLLPAFHIHLLNNTPQYILITLYIMAPAQTIAQLMPYFSYANIGIERFERLQQELSTAMDTATGTISDPVDFKMLEFKNICYAYESVEDNQTTNFHIGPINLIITPGEVLFISGANGSGKSTFVKLLAGLYYPQSGSISVNDKTVSDHNYQSYREVFHCIFADNYLSDILYGGDDALAADINTWFANFSIGNKVKIEGKVYDNIALSDGQKKRISLGAAMVSTKPVFIFDEFAANQDPGFREYFYLVILPFLKAKNKAIVVITHDDHYFHCADRHLKMDNGMLI